MAKKLFNTLFKRFVALAQELAEIKEAQLQLSVRAVRLEKKILKQVVKIEKLEEKCIKNS